jgi:hypothetical protein
MKMRNLKDIQRQFKLIEKTQGRPTAEEYLIKVKPKDLSESESKAFDKMFTLEHEWWLTELMYPIKKLFSKF